MSLSLVASFVAHGALLLAMAVPSVRDRLIRPDDLGATAPSQAQTWSGTTAELPSGETLYDVQLTGSQGLGAIPEPPATSPAPPMPPAEPAPSPPAETSPKTTPAPPPPPSPPPKEPVRPAPKPESPTKPEPKATPASPKPPPDDEEDPYADVSLPKEPPAIAANPKPASSSGGDATEPSTDEPKSGLGGTGTSGGSFGAVGRAGVRDLGAAFTQAIPAACGADTTWSEIALGDGGTIRIALDIDENGRLKSFTPLEKNPPKQLRNLAKRTFDLLQSGTFALRPGGVTAGRQTVEVSATVAMTDKPTTSGGLIELGHTFGNGVGRAHFVQSTGREVRLSIRVIRIEVTAAPTGSGG